MKHPAVLQSLIMGAALVLSAWIVGCAVESFGNSLRRSAANLSFQRGPAFPSNLTVHIDFAQNPLRIATREER